ncbi:MAG: hypothetical protein MJ089_03075 [Ruminococcus sp.]|nr:hypothetical protein [Ruminococcus sp.]
MAYESRNAAYDLSLFEEASVSSGSAVPQHKPKEEKVHKQKFKNGSRVLNIPEDELNKIRRRKHNPIKLFLGGLGGAVVAMVIGTIIVGQVQLTELNQEIISAKAMLADAESVYTQNEMKVEAKLSNSAIQDYAENQLGMTKATNAQKEYVTFAGGDKAEVSAKVNDNIFSQFIESIKNLWS